MNSIMNKNGKTNIRLLILLAVLIAVVGITYKLFMTQDEKDITNSLASSIGIEAVVPWEERAITATKNTMELSKEALANTIVSYSHPSAKSARLEEFVVNSSGSNITVQLKVSFVGGFSGTKYLQIGQWKFSKDQNFGYMIVSDNAPFKVEEKNLSKIDEYFQKEVYPVTLGNIK